MSLELALGRFRAGILLFVFGGVTFMDELFDMMFITITKLQRVNTLLNSQPIESKLTVPRDSYLAEIDSEYFGLSFSSLVLPSFEGVRFRKMLEGK